MLGVLEFRSVQEVGGFPGWSAGGRAPVRRWPELAALKPAVSHWVQVVAIGAGWHVVGTGSDRVGSSVPGAVWKGRLWETEWGGA
jgi:hypothetical protein